MSASVIPFPMSAHRSGSGDRQSPQAGTTWKAELSRRYATREEASSYLSSRGFHLLPDGRANGRWSATLEREKDQFIVAIRLVPAKAA